MSAIQIAKEQLPSKWDIIPIHATDRAAFKFCRRQWGWSSPSKHNLVPKASVHGIREALWFGSGIHFALEKYYSPVLREDPIVAFETWFELQVNGGLVTESQLPEFADRNPKVSDRYSVKRVDNHQKPDEILYSVDGLSDILPDVGQIDFNGYLELARGMLTFYKEYAEEYDNFTVIATEQLFSVPLTDDKGSPLYMLDNRAMPEDWIDGLTDRGIPENSFGPLYVIEVRDNTILVRKQVHARGKIDLILRDNESGRYGIKDYKTTSRLDDDYFRHLELDEQTITYLWAGEGFARLYDLPYKKLDFIIYEALLKAFPRPPTITSRGLPSVDRQNESTTAELFEKCIKDNGLQPIFDADERMQNYYTWLLELGDKRFIHRKPVFKNLSQRRNAGRRMYYEAIDMLNNPVLYPNPTKNYSCLNCIFRAPCIAAEDGSDYQMILRDGYVQNWDR